MSFNLNWLGTSLSNATLASIIYNVINNLQVSMGIMVHRCYFHVLKIFMHAFISFIMICMEDA